MNIIALETPVRARPRRRIGLFGWLGLARQRRALGRLDSDRLADIGVSPAEAARESRRPIWDGPDHWRA